MTLSLFAAEHTAATEARESEFHPTPGEVVRALVHGMRAAGHEPLPWHGNVLEGMAGDGALIEAVNLLVPSKTRQWSAYDIHQEARATLQRKALAWPVGRDFFAIRGQHWDLHVTNPAWSKAIECAEHSLTVADHAALHVPLATVETPERRAFFRRRPADLYPLDWRPNYDGRGTIGRAVCWIVWGPGRGGRWFPLARTEHA